MNVKLTSLTQPIVYKVHNENNEIEIIAGRSEAFKAAGEEGWYTALDPQEYIAYIARVSNPGNQNNLETSEKLLKYCLKNGHFSVFEMFDLTFEIECTRDIGRQILRHDMNFQEWSQRYSDPTILGFELKECRLQDNKNRQNSIETDDEELSFQWKECQDEIIRNAKEAYQWAIDNGIAKEQARAVLPEGLILSKIYAKNNLRNWIFYCQLRMKNGTQKEHSLIAKEIWQTLCNDNLFPFLKGYYNG